MEGSFRIVFEEDGYPRELINAADRARAVRDEALTPDMDVTIYRDNGPPGVYKAGDIEELRPLFGLDEPSANILSPEKDHGEQTVAEGRAAGAVRLPRAAQPTTRLTVGPWSLPVQRETEADPGEDAVVDGGNGSAEPVLDRDSTTTADGVRIADEPNKHAFLWVLAGVVGFLFLVGTCSTKPNETVNSTTDYAADDTLLGVDANLGIPPVTGRSEVNSEEIARSEMHYAVRLTNVREQPTANSANVGQLSRGASVLGVLVPGTNPEHQWLKITTGEHAGYFVSADSNLSRSRRPELDLRFSGSKSISQSAPIYADPDRGSQILQYAEPGTALEIVGAVSDQLVEVSLRDGRIGYVDRSAFESAAEPLESEQEAQDLPETSENEVAKRPVTQSPDPVKLTGSARSPVLRNRSGLISEEDYPAGSLRAEETGTVGISVDVGVNGRATNCRVIRSSGFERLDRATCQLVERRARFDPALDARGLPVAGTFDGSWTWRLD